MKCKSLIFTFCRIFSYSWGIIKYLMWLNYRHIKREHTFLRMDGGWRVFKIKWGEKVAKVKKMKNERKERFAMLCLSLLLCLATVNIWRTPNCWWWLPLVNKTLSVDMEIFINRFCIVGIFFQWVFISTYVFKYTHTYIYIYFKEICIYFNRNNIVERLLVLTLFCVCDH